MGSSRSSRLEFPFVETRKFMVSISLRHMLQLFSGLPFDWCSFWKFYLVWNPNKETPPICSCWCRRSQEYICWNDPWVKKARKSSQVQEVYCLHQSPWVFWLYLTEKMNLCGMEQSTYNPCLFIGAKVTCICYVADLIFWGLTIYWVVFGHLSQMVMPCILT